MFILMLSTLPFSATSRYFSVRHYARFCPIGTRVSSSRLVRCFDRTMTACLLERVLRSNSKIFVEVHVSSRRISTKHHSKGRKPDARYGRSLLAQLSGAPDGGRDQRLDRPLYRCACARLSQLSHQTPPRRHAIEARLNTIRSELFPRAASVHFWKRAASAVLFPNLHRRKLCRQLQSVKAASTLGFKIWLSVFHSCFMCAGLHFSS